MENISIIIVHHDTDKDTKECLESLAKLQHDGFKHQIVVVDNGSREPLTLGKKQRSKLVEVLRSEANLGFTGGNNLGITHALETYHSDYFLLLNSDTTVKSDFLSKLYHRLQKEQVMGLVCPKIYFSQHREFFKKDYQSNQKGKVLWYAGGSIDWLNLAASHRGVDEVDRGHFDQQTKSDFATGCCLLIPREIIEKVGLLDDRYFLYLEDLDLSLRAKDQGYPVLFEPTAVIWHKNAGSTEGSGSRIHQYYQTRNRLLFFIERGRLKVKLRTLLWLIKVLYQGKEVERQAAADFVFRRLGKQPLI